MVKFNFTFNTITYIFLIKNFYDTFQLELKWKRTDTISSLYFSEIICQIITNIEKLVKKNILKYAEQN